MAISGATITVQTITFFPTEAAAQHIADMNGGADEGFIVARAAGRPGKFVIVVSDPDDDGLILGHL